MYSKDKLKEILKSIGDLEYYFDADLTNYSTIRLKAEGDLVIVKSIDALRLLLLQLNQNKISYKLLGWGANQLLRNRPDFLYIKLQLPFEKKYLENVRNEYELPASVSLALLTSAAAKLGLKGWEVFTGIPASLGGAIAMNAGTNKGEIGELVKTVKLVNNNGEIENIEIGPNSFSYRKNTFLSPGDVVVSAVLGHKGVDENIKKTITDYLKWRNETQPMAEKTCGCMFKNANFFGRTCRAGQYVDILGLKGLTYKKNKIGHKHANFLINTGEAIYDESVEFIKLIQDEMKLNYGMAFEIEFEI